MESRSSTRTCTLDVAHRVVAPPVPKRLAASWGNEFPGTLYASPSYCSHSIPSGISLVTFPIEAIIYSMCFVVVDDVNATEQWKLYMLTS